MREQDTQSESMVVTKDCDTSRSKSILRNYFQPAFLVCAGVLAIGGASMSIAIERFGLYLKKEPLPLRKPLSSLDERDLSPYKVVSKIMIENREILKSLGTDDYVQWILKDMEADSDSAVQRCMLFITYYPLPDRVPHVPEECYTGGGYEKLSSEKKVLTIRTDGFEEQLKSRHVLFGRSGMSNWGPPEFPVVYIFKVNGEYAGNREEARIALNKNIFGKCSYFAKIEIVFNQLYTRPTEQEAVSASEKLLSVVLPILEHEYFPIWESE